MVTNEAIVKLDPIDGAVVVERQALLMDIYSFDISATNVMIVAYTEVHFCDLNIGGCSSLSFPAFYGSGGMIVSNGDYLILD